MACSVTERSQVLKSSMLDNATVTVTGGLDSILSCINRYITMLDRIRVSQNYGNINMAHVFMTDVMIFLRI